MGETVIDGGHLDQSVSSKFPSIQVSHSLANDFLVLPSP